MGTSRKPVEDTVRPEEKAASRDPGAKRGRDAPVGELFGSNEQRLRAIFNRAAMGIATADVTGRFLEANDKVTDLLGYTREELRDLTFTAVTHPSDLEATEREVKRLLAGEIPHYALEK